MPKEYDFSMLSPREFEFLCRDLIQRRISKETNTSFFFNSFNEGPGKGIDAVFKNDKENVVLQCKRYSSFKSLIHELKHKEVRKVRLLKPGRYIFATSVGLLSSEAEQIYQLFQPYVINTNDVVDRNMLNNLLAEYPDIAVSKIVLTGYRCAQAIF